MFLWGGRVLKGRSWGRVDVISLLWLRCRRCVCTMLVTMIMTIISYLHRVDETHHPSPLCPLCKTHPHTTDHLFNCTHLYTSSNILDLWLSPERVAPLLIRWKRRRASLENLGCQTPPQLHAGGVGRQQHDNDKVYYQN